MNRINGFLDLNELPFENFSNSKYAYDHLWVNIDGNRYYLKYSTEPYSELIAYEIAKLLDIEAIEYDLAMYGPIVGVISKDYHKEGRNYSPGYKICTEYYVKNFDTMKKMGLEKTAFCDEINAPFIFESNNLENIWQALEYKYANYPPEEITKVMYKLIDQFNFMILTDSPDKGSQNWEIEEGENSLDLVPLYDNECIYNFANTSVGMSVTFEDVDFSMDDVLFAFLKISSKEYVDVFIEKYDKLKAFGMEKIIENVEKKIGSIVPYKKEYIYNFNCHMKLIARVLNKLEKENNIRR